MAEVAEDEDVFYEGRGAPAELIISLLLGATLLYLVRSINLIRCCSLQHLSSICTLDQVSCAPHVDVLAMQPLTAQSIGRRLWISYKFTSKRLVVSNT